LKTIIKLTAASNASVYENIAILDDIRSITARSSPVARPS